MCFPIFQHSMLDMVKTENNTIFMNNADRFNKCLTLYKIPTVFANLDLTNDMWSFHVNFSSMITPKNFVAQTPVILLFIDNTHIVNIFTIAK